jgi:hypothetical protein
MSRKLNIERRQKRIRHYHARRRQRSLLRRAFSYWWSTTLILIFVILAVSNTFLWLRSQRLHAPPSFTLPKARESVHYVPREEIQAFLSRGVLQHASRLLSDQDVGLSLEHALPELPQYCPRPLGDFPQPQQVKPSLSSMLLVPSCYTTDFNKKAYNPPTYNQAFSEALQEAGYTFLLPVLPENEAGEATFFVQISADGKVDSVLKISPQGQESPFLRQLRLALLKGTAQGEASGTIRFQWRSKESR